MGMSPALLKTDIIPIINLAWNQSFSRIDSNKKAISDRGWNPLNRALLKDPAIMKTRVLVQNDNQQAKSRLDPPQEPTETVNPPSPTPPTEIFVPLDEDSEVSILSEGTMINPSLTVPRIDGPMVTVTRNDEPRVAAVTRSDEPSIAATLNLATGFAGTIMTDIIQHAKIKKDSLLV
mmetsp:Transcript_19133/g.27550  ORF Transcript_19133/g.27550 Transcript_19133/m.27550 type:complete len:177 (-) Transcript_19133:603-1133(-)